MRGRRGRAARERAGALALLLASLAERAGGMYDPVHKLESARLYGNIAGYNYYFVDITVGTPPQRVSVILDTGSGLLAFPCAGCPHCGKHIDPLFDFGRSTSATWVRCDSRECTGDRRSKCRGRGSDHCGYSQGYLEGSSISGWWFLDYLHMGDSIQRNPPVYAKMGCHQNENKLFYTQAANGIFGIQGQQSVLHTFFADKGHVDSSAFSICLAVEGGALTVGGHNESVHAGPLQYIKQLGSGYGVEVSSLAVGTASIPIEHKYNAIIDSGTTYTYLNRKHYQALRKAIEDHCGNGRCSAVQHGDCWEVRGGLDHFPQVEVTFDHSVRTAWWPREYMYQRGSKWCYSFKDDGMRPTTTLGASWMLYKEIIFDLANKRIGVAPARCPSYVKRPDHFSDADRIRPPDASEVAAPAAGEAAALSPASTAGAAPQALAPAAAPGAPGLPGAASAEPAAAPGAPDVQGASGPAPEAAHAPPAGAPAEAPDASDAPGARPPAVAAPQAAAHSAAAAAGSRGSPGQGAADGAALRTRGQLLPLALLAAVALLVAVPVVKLVRGGGKRGADAEERAEARPDVYGAAAAGATDSGAEELEGLVDDR